MHGGGAEQALPPAALRHALPHAAGERGKVVLVGCVDPVQMLAAAAAARRMVTSLLVIVPMQSHRGIASRHSQAGAAACSRPIRTSPVLLVSRAGLY